MKSSSRRVTPVDLAELLVRDVGEWREWLESHATASPGVRLVLAKKGRSVPTSLTYDQALEEALCVGWIDGVLSARDDETFRRRFTPRRGGSRWSRRNVEIVERLIEEGRLAHEGLDQVRRAKEDGRWERAYDGQASLTVPDDLARALAGAPRAAAAFESLPRATKFSITYRLSSLRRADSRERRVAEIVASLERDDSEGDDAT